MNAAHPRKVPWIRLVLVLVVLSVLSVHRLFSARSATVGEVFTGEAMGTTYAVRVAGSVRDPVERDALSHAITSAIEDVEARMSTYRAQSELVRLSRAATTEPVAVSEPLFAVLRAAEEVSQASGGAFDVTVAPLVDLWGFGPAGRPDGGTPPLATSVAFAKERTGWAHLELDPSVRTVRKKRADVAIDLSAIAKGHAVDRVAVVLEKAGRSSYLVEIGGEVRARGRSASGEPWRVGIERPTSGPRSVLTSTRLEDGALATSGSYRNHYESAGRRIAHAIDPRTGSPIEHTLLSVSVLGETCMMADAWATALLVLGPEDGPRLADTMKLAALFITEDEGGRLQERATAGFSGRSVRNEEPEKESAGFGTILLLALAIIALAMGAMALGLFAGKALRGSCGGPCACAELGKACPKRVDANRIREQPADDPQ
jgi:FAD:protein FMN transferase